MEPEQQLFQHGNGRPIRFALHAKLGRVAHLQQLILQHGGELVEPAALAEDDFLVISSCWKNAKSVAYLAKEMKIVTVDRSWVMESAFLGTLLPWYSYQPRISWNVDDEVEDILQLAVYLARFEDVSGRGLAYSFLAKRHPHQNVEQFQVLQEQCRPQIDEHIIKIKEYLGTRILRSSPTPMPKPSTQLGFDREYEQEVLAEMNSLQTMLIERAESVLTVASDRSDLYPDFFQEESTSIDNHTPARHQQEVLQAIGGPTSEWQDSGFGMDFDSNIQESIFDASAPGMLLASATGIAGAITENEDEEDLASTYEYDAMRTWHASHPLFKGENIGQYWSKFEQQDNVGNERSYWQWAKLDKRHCITQRLKVTEAQLLNLSPPQNATEHETSHSGRRKNPVRAKNAKTCGGSPSKPSNVDRQKEACSQSPQGLNRTDRARS
ncbi:hypothetical protein M408DRAFT_330472 [Serendipita vermifera MAFF 305830]|uniref:BRCT domain-containing protein n=1 Tax=Serendipita vermifera MAFF 305830 TaxID=933852 RepID=A0A0C2WK46_SERVB|nr:hypothetical protein M408DRAFT_330472 [Serendipita vermifera MAFF 305830]